MELTSRTYFLDNPGYCSEVRREFSVFSHCNLGKILRMNVRAATAYLRHARPFTDKGR